MNLIPITIMTFSLIGCIGPEFTTENPDSIELHKDTGTDQTPDSGQLSQLPESSISTEDSGLIEDSPSNYPEVQTLQDSGVPVDDRVQTPDVLDASPNCIDGTCLDGEVTVDSGSIACVVSQCPSCTIGTVSCCRYSECGCLVNGIDCI